MVTRTNRIEHVLRIQVSIMHLLKKLIKGVNHRVIPQTKLTIKTLNLQHISEISTLIKFKKKK